MQVLNLDKGRQLVVERTFTDQGIEPTFGLIAGKRTLIEVGFPPRPRVHMARGAFFFDDGSAVKDVADIDWIPEPYRSMALTILRGSQSDDPKAKRMAGLEKARAIRKANIEAKRPRPPVPGPKEINRKAVGAEADRPVPAGSL